MVAKMRLIILYQTGDECTWSRENVVPIEYESAEAFLVEFQERCTEIYLEPTGMDFLFANRYWDPCDFFSYPSKEFITPEILTVDEWFNRSDWVRK